VEIRVKTLPWSVWLRTLKRNLMETMEITSNKLKALCEVDWPAVGVGWSPERSLDITVVNEVYKVIVGRPGYLDQFPCIDCWQNAVLSRPTWLRLCLEEACRITVARVTAPSKCREKNKGAYWLRNLRKCHCPMGHFIHLCHQHPVPQPQL
jgi:hypothetical protein